MYIRWHRTTIDNNCKSKLPSLEVSALIKLSITARYNRCIFYVDKAPDESGDKRSLLLDVSTILRFLIPPVYHTYDNVNFEF